MQPLHKRWRVETRITPEAEEALRGYPEILRQILFNRGYATREAARGYLEARRPPGTEAQKLKGIPEAVDRIRSAAKQKGKIAIYGDYDADGVTGTALLVNALKELGYDVLGYIPNRFDEGYGLNNDALNNLKQAGVGLVVTVDCGIRSLEEAEYAHKLNLDLIISDHHHPANELPQALAIINPKQAQDSYPEKDLAGVGLAYKLATALMEDNPEKADQFLDLVALGTVADLAPLVGENRALVRLGLEQMRRPHRQGVMSLIGVTGLQPSKITAGDIGYVLGPRLNAAGRLDTALAALNLLTTHDVRYAAELAQLLDSQNRERQKITHEIQEAAEKLALREGLDTLLLFAAQPDFNPGVVGLAASRLTEAYYRPSIVAYIGDELTRASCRSIPEFHITNALDQCADLLVRYGGHAAAAGFTVTNQNLPALIEQLRDIAQQELALLDLRPTLIADLELSLSELEPELIEHLSWLQPTGYGNRRAYFVSRDLKVVWSKAIGKDYNHLKLTVTDGYITYDAIAFRQGYWQEQMPEKVDLLYNFELNEYNGRSTLQLNVKDMKPSGVLDD